MEEVGNHKRVYEYDGAFKCLDCQTMWGALPNRPKMPDECIVPDKDSKRGHYIGLDRGKE